MTQQMSRKQLPSQSGGAGLKEKPLVKSDFAAAFVTDRSHEDFIRFSRVWRQVRFRFMYKSFTF